MARSRTTAPPWNSGQSGNPAGRPLGSRHKLSDKFILALHDDFAEHGHAVIKKVREEHPAVYLQVIGKLVPRELHFRNDSVLAGISDEQLNDVLGRVTGALAARAPRGADLGATPADSEDKLN
jgi:hypothetical protein